MRVIAGAVELEVTVRGEGEAVVLVPSRGRGAADFGDLAGRLAAAGFRAAAVDPRGVGVSSGPLEALTLHDLAADIAVVAAQLEPPVHVVGHALGNRVARCLATDRPELVRSVVLLAAGGQVAIAEQVRTALERSFELSLPDEVRMAAVAVAFFAPGNDPSVWRDGWWPEAARAQQRAVAATDPAEWRRGGSASMLIIQGLDDRVAVPENGRLLQQELGRRVTLVELADAGHALLPEQPEAIAAAVIDYLRSQQPAGLGSLRPQHTA